MLALLEMYQYFIDDFTLQVNPTLKEAEEYEVDLNVDFEIGRSNDDKPNFEVKLLVDVNQKDEFFRNAPYRVHLLVTGYFHFPEGTDEDNINKLILPNGLSILYGIARNTVSQSTGVARFGRFLLPSINLIKVIQDKAKKEETIEEKN